METAQAIELIEKSEHIALLLPQKPTVDIFCAAEALSQTLLGREKTVGFLQKSDMGSLPPGLFQNTRRAQPLLKEFIVSLDTKMAPISEIRYEKTDDRLDIIFSPKSLSIEKSSVSFRDGKTRADLVIALGIHDLEREHVLTMSPEFFTETPILNIDISEDNKQYGEADLVAVDTPTLAEVVYELLTALTQSPLPKGPATLLLGGILAQTNHFREIKTNADTFRIASELLRLGADRAAAREISEHGDPLPLLQLFGRATVRSRVESEQGVVWSFVTEEDFEKTGRSAADIPAVLDHIETSFPPHRVAALLWHDLEKKSIRAALTGERTVLEKIAERGLGHFQSPHILLIATFDEFKEAEERIRSLLAGVL